MHASMKIGLHENFPLYGIFSAVMACMQSRSLKYISNYDLVY